MSRSFLFFAGVALVCAACSSPSSTTGSGGAGATTTTTTTKTATGTGGSSSSSSTGTGGTGGDAGATCSDPTNPLLTSCLVPFLAGCWAPDMSGTCTDMNGVLTWSDGSKYVSKGTGTGLYAPGDTSPCVSMVISGSTITGTKGSETLVYAFDQTTMTATITCPDLSKVTATSAQVTAFNHCHGLNCP
jgi:hypothetical protein